MERFKRQDLAEKGQLESSFATTASGLADPANGREARASLRSFLERLEADLPDGKRRELTRLTTEALKLAYGVGRGELHSRGERSL